MGKIGSIAVFLVVLAAVIWGAIILISPEYDFEKGRAAFARNDYDGALREWMPLADDGDAASQNLLGAMYATGKGVERDYLEANKWYSLAARQGYVPAQAALGLVYMHGLGVIPNYETAYMWFEVAMQNGSDQAEKHQETLKPTLDADAVTDALWRAQDCVSSGYEVCE